MDDEDLKRILISMGINESEIEVFISHASTDLRRLLEMCMKGYEETPDFFKGFIKSSNYFLR